MPAAVGPEGVYGLELAGEDDAFAAREAACGATAVESVAPGLATARGVDVNRLRTLAYTHRTSRLLGRCAAAIDAARASMGRLTATVNCAGIATAEKTLGREGPHRLESFRRTVDVNLVGTFNVARLAASAMSENTASPDGLRGVIVNTASIAAFDGQKGQAAYAASKAGIAGLSLPMARDLARDGIRVMAIAPGIFRTPMLIGLGEEVMQGLANDVTCPRRLGDPAEFADLARFIIASDYLNGETIRLDGALRMR